MVVHMVSKSLILFFDYITDVPKSAVRKAGRGMPSYTLCFRVCKTTFRGHTTLHVGSLCLNPIFLLISLCISTGHFLGVLASWLVQVAIDVYGFFSKTTKPAEESDAIVTAEQARVLGKKVVGTTVRCVGSLVFASIGAGIGVALIRPSTGQWIGTTQMPIDTMFKILVTIFLMQCPFCAGCVLGDLAGPVIITFCFERLHWEL